MVNDNVQAGNAWIAAGLRVPGGLISGACRIADTASCASGIGVVETVETGAAARWLSRKRPDRLSENRIAGDLPAYRRSLR